MTWTMKEATAGLAEAKATLGGVQITMRPLPAAQTLALQVFIPDPDTPPGPIHDAETIAANGKRMAAEVAAASGYVTSAEGLLWNFGGTTCKKYATQAADELLGRFSEEEIGGAYAALRKAANPDEAARERARGNSSSPSAAGQADGSPTSPPSTPGHP